MDWQLMLVVPAVALAALFLGRRSWRTWFGRSGCAGCGRASATSGRPRETLIPAEQLTLRRRP